LAIGGKATEEGRVESYHGTLKRHLGVMIHVARAGLVKSWD